MTGLWILHALGRAEGGAPWRSAFRDWPGPVSAPDLPGHGQAPPPPGGHLGFGDEAFGVAHAFPSAEDAPVVLGVGHSARTAVLLALAGRARGVVVVDGLGGPWGTPVERNAAFRAQRRAILADPAALAPVPVGVVDPRHDDEHHLGDREFAVQLLEALTVPFLAVESPASRTPDPHDVVAGVGDAAVIELDDGDPAVVARAVQRWWADCSA